MRVVIKPGGVAVLLLATFLVLFVAYQAVRTHHTATTPTVANAAPPSATGTFVGKTVSLANADFEGDYSAASAASTQAFPSAPERLQGELANGWHDDSAHWTNAVMHYSADTTYPHGGRQCQKIRILKLSLPRDAFYQLAQPVTLAPETTYTASLWVRAERPIPVTLLLRRVDTPVAPYGMKQVLIGKEWTRITVKGTVGKIKGDSFLMLQTPASNVNLWVDDATVTVGDGN